MIDEIVAPLLAARRNVGLVVGVLDGEERRTFGYGEAQHDSGLAPDGNTLFEIGSVTKTFTGLLLAIMVDEGLLTLDDSVCDLVPELSHLPPEMTLLRLATHTAGLPFLPFHPIPYLLKGKRNPLADFTADDLLAVVKRRQPKEPLPPLAEAKVHYSNVGLGLLGYTLAQRLGTTYEEAVLARICDGLGLSDTCITLTREQRARLATPHSPRGKRTSNWEMPGLVGAGALRSTANDMLRYLAGQAAPDSGIPADVRQICHQIYVAMPPTPERGLVAILSRWLARRLDMEMEHESVGMALTWAVVQAPGGRYRVYIHDGETGGYTAFAGFVPETGSGVTVLLNRSVGGYDLLFPAPTVMAIGFRVLRMVLQDEA